MPDDILFSSSIDPKQVSRIEATHRGFLYQHLYGAACLLEFSDSGAYTLITENDEDIELVWPDKWIYVQVKTRSNPLQWNDIREAIERFVSLRKEHTERRRSGTPEFVIISNVEPGPELSARIQDASWPKGVFLQTPSTKNPRKDIPPAWTDLPEAIKWCTENASDIPLLSVHPETLVWKLASRIQYAATGYNDHKISSEEVPLLLDQLIIQLQHFPEAPIDYKSQTDEPAISSDSQLRLITGVSGSGKTSWAAQSVLHSADSWAYFDVSDLPPTALASSLARELVAQFLGGEKTGIVATVLGSGSGLNMLRVISDYLDKEKVVVNVVLDNAHLLNAEILQTITSGAQHVKFLLLAQPSPEMKLVEAAFNIREEELKGWSMDVIAHEFANAKCPVDAETAKRILDFTLGLPLFVQSTVQIVSESYKCDAKSFCQDIENRQQAKDTAQDLILKKAFDQLTPNAKKLAGFLSLSDVPLKQSEIETFVSESKNKIAVSLRELNRYGIIRFALNGDVKLHDIYRGLAKDQFLENPDEEIFKAKIALAKVLEVTMPSGLGRFGLWLRLLAQTDQIDVLVDLATYEWFHEMGDPKELKSVLEDASTSTAFNVEDRLWALDALIFWDTQDRLYDNIPDRVKSMQLLAKDARLSVKAQVAIAMKCIIRAGFANDIAGIEDSFKQAMSLVGHDVSVSRLVRYNRAYAHFHAESYLEAKKELDVLIIEYYDHLKLEIKDVMLKSLAHTHSIVARIPTWQDDVKHLADCLDMLSGVKKALNEQLGLEQIHALKFYTISGAYSSAIRVGQNAVDQLVGLNAFPEARDTIENKLLPLIREGKLIQHEIEVRSQYAVVLAYCGEIAAAEAEIERLKAYDVTPQQRAEIQNQSNIINAVASGLLRLNAAPKIVIPNTPASEKKVGRNDPCPCGSGLKYKKCHG